MTTTERSPEIRRTFFGWMIGIAMSAIGLSLAIPLAGSVIAPALIHRATSWAAM